MNTVYVEVAHASPPKEGIGTTSTTIYKVH